MRMGRVATNSLFPKITRRFHGRVDRGVQAEQDSVVETGASKRYYHAEPERSAHDNLKEFDLIVPRRLGPRVAGTTKTQTVHDALEWLQVHTVNHESKQRRTPQLELRNNHVKLGYLGPNSKTERGHQRRNHSKGAEEVLITGSKNTVPRSVAQRLDQQHTPQYRHTKLNYLSKDLPTQTSGYDSSRKDDLQQAQDQHLIDKKVKFTFDTPLGSMTDDRTPDSNQQHDLLTPVTGHSIKRSTDGYNVELRAKEQPSPLSSLHQGFGGEKIIEHNITLNGSEPAASVLQASAFSESINAQTSSQANEKEDFWPTWGDEKESELQSNLRTDLKADEMMSVETALEQGELKDEIHILGTGVVGKFVAHSLAGISRPPKITLLMQTPLSMQQWHDEGESITLHKQGKLRTRRGFNIESAANIERTRTAQWHAAFGQNFEHPVQNPKSVIDTLIVTTPAKVTVQALLVVRDRLRPTSTICFVNDGLGIIEAVNAIVYPDPQRRPTYVLGNLTGNTNLSPNSERQFTIEQKGDVHLTCSKLPQRSVFLAEAGPTITKTDFSWTLSALYLMRNLTRAPELQTKTLAHKSYIKNQLYHVIAHAVIGPISILYDCSYIDLLQSHHARLAMQGLIEEISHIVLAFPELERLRNVERDLSPGKLEVMIRRVLGNNHRGISAMLQNVRAGKRTDIDYYNGYLLLRAAELGIECPRNEMLVNVVKGKQSIVSKQKNRIIPLADE